MQIFKSVLELVMLGFSFSVFSLSKRKFFNLGPSRKHSTLFSSDCMRDKCSLSGLSFCTNENALSEAFSQYGQVVEAKIVMDKVSEKSKGFGFVTFASVDEAHNALTEMNGKALNGRVIFVDYAKPKTSYRDEVPIVRGPPEHRPNS